MLRLIERYNVKYAINRYKSHAYLLASVAVIGIIFGIVCHRQIQSAQWLLSDSWTTGFVLGSSFILLLWKLFINSALLLLLVSIVVSVPYTWCLTYVIVFYKALSFVSAMITLIKYFTVVGMLFGVLLTVYQIAVLTAAILLFVMLRSAYHSAPCGNTLRFMLQNAATLAAALIFSLALALAVSLVAFVFIKTVIVFL